MLFSTAIYAALAASSALALPYMPINPPLPGHGAPASPACSLKSAVLDLPAGQTILAAPTGTLEQLALGVGIQNYTCQSGVWTSVGAVASLYDISCAVGTPMFDYSQTAELKTLATKTAPILSHFFVENPTAGGTGVDPRFNLEPYATTKVSSTLAKTNSLASPQGASNVAWLQLTNIVGSLATSVYRVDTSLGQPPASCNAATDTSTLTVAYTAKYWFYKS